MHVMWSADVWSAIAAGASVVAAGGSLWVAVKAKQISSDALNTAKEATSAAKIVADIERVRIRHDMMPDLAVEIRKTGDAGVGRARLTVRWNGPSVLERLAEVRVRVLDDGRDHSFVLPSNPAEGPTVEELQAQVWGPYQLQSGLEGVSGDGRTAVQDGLYLGSTRSLMLEQTQSPHRDLNARLRWSMEFGRQPVRLHIECKHEDFGPWVQVYEIDVVDPHTATQTTR
ncbi:hypothetical protein ABT236_35075 [Streptomyces sp. NPDC001523]|uniref:hypothetical protein n=1 Tax=Streptomyces sp. NPDC001523 TaxID=3154383 RepID=UPI003318344A